ncbi:MAG: hypothetical protein AB7Y46_19045, partial [Armatimonadota bacterium]
ESKKGFVIDHSEVRHMVGPERPLLGNIDAVALRDGDEATIRRLVSEQFGAAGPLLAASCGSPLTLDTDPRKLDIMVQAAECAAR